MTIHLITAGKYQNQEDWPETWLQCFKSLSKVKEDICFWNDEGIEKLLKEDDNEFYENYLLNLNPIYKWDYVRYIILNKYGGAYMDMDIELVIDFFPLLNSNSVYLAEGTSGTYVENSIMICPKNFDITYDPPSIFFERVKDFCKDKIMLNYNKCLEDKRRVLYTTGGRALSEFVITQKHFFNELNINRLAYEHFGSINNTLSFTRHHQTSTWMEKINNK
tara:strand:+ start:124 stop:783 length:660 start_codon:yes stop_codon:yes gene_type:complete